MTKWAMVHKSWGKNITIVLSSLVFVLISVAASSQSTNYTTDAAFDNEINSLLSYSVPILSVHELHDMQDDVLILDAREIEEFELSKIPGAAYIGHKNPDFSVCAAIAKDTPIVVYCSVGYRSEKVGESLQQRGFTHVYNLYGSIFEWANVGYPLLDQKGNTTNQVHTYNKSWSKWIRNSKIAPQW